MSDDFYRAFEERYYAPQSVIKQLRQQYLPFVQPLVTHHPESQTFDLGCGRGEWLEIMTEIGLKPYGMDLDDGMLRACHEKGLPAHKGDAVEYLKTLTSESQLVITAFHVVEHITFSELRTVVSEALRVLKPGGLLIMETPNPENITVATRNFYLDPTHQRPIPPQLLSFLPEYDGFARVKVIRLQEDKSLTGKAWTTLRDVLGGVSPDYAVVAQKSADPLVLDCTSDAFAKEYGLTLDTLVDKFDQQAQQVSERATLAEVQAQQASARAAIAEAETRVAQAEAQTQQASARAAIAEAETRVAQAEAQAQQASARAAIAEAETRVAQAEAQAQQASARAAELDAKLEATGQELHNLHQANHHHWQLAEARYQQIEALQASTSWRITAPLRWVSSLVRNPTSNALKNRAKVLLQHTGLYIGRRPLLKNAAIKVLHHFPNIKTRLAQTIRQTTIQPSQLQAAQFHNMQANIKDLTPHARQIYADLKVAIERRQKDLS